MKQDLLETKDVAAQLHCTVGNVRRLMSVGRLKKINLGGRRIYTTQESVDRYRASGYKSGTIRVGNKNALHTHHDNLRQVIRTLLQNRRDFFWVYLLEQGEPKFIFETSKGRHDITEHFEIKPLGIAPHRPIETLYPGTVRIIGEHLPDWRKLREQYVNVTEANRYISYRVCRNQIRDELRSNEEKQIRILEEALNEPFFPGTCHICAKYYNS